MLTPIIKQHQPEILNQKSHVEQAFLANPSNGFDIKQDLLTILIKECDPFVNPDSAMGPEMSEEDCLVANWHTWQELIASLMELRSLDDDWDGQGAKAPARELLASACSLAGWLRDKQIIPAHYAIAGVNGTIHFEWINSQRSFGIEVVAPGVAEVYSVNRFDNSVASCSFQW